jgi:hypothetical protein
VCSVSTQTVALIFLVDGLDVFAGEPMNRVEIAFDCLPLRSATRLDVPLDASPGYRRKCEAIKNAIKNHGSHNTYYLHNAHCNYFLTNDQKVGSLHFKFQGTAFTDGDDSRCISTSLEVSLSSETCDWLTEPIVDWFCLTVEKSVQHEFNRYIEAGDLSRTQERIRKMEQSQDTEGGFLGMYL